MKSDSLRPDRLTIQFQIWLEKVCNIITTSVIKSVLFYKAPTMAT